MRRRDSSQHSAARRCGRWWRGQESRPKDAAKPTQRPAAKRQFQRDDWRYEVEDPRGGRWIYPPGDTHE